MARRNLVHTTNGFRRHHPPRPAYLIHLRHTKGDVIGRSGAHLGKNLPDGILHQRDATVVFNK